MTNLYLTLTIIGVAFLYNFIWIVPALLRHNKKEVIAKVAHRFYLVLIPITLIFLAIVSPEAGLLSFSVTLIFWGLIMCIVQQELYEYNQQVWSEHSAFAANQISNHVFGQWEYVVRGIIVIAVGLFMGVFVIVNM